MAGGAAAIALIILSLTQAATAGCPTEILDCNAQRQALCAAQQCSSNLVCRIKNCGACTAVCEPHGTVSIMSVGGGSQEAGSRPATPGSTAAAPGTTKLVNATQQQQQPKQQQPPQRPCPRSYIPVCGSDAKVYANDCLAGNAGVKVTGRPDASGKCPTAGGNSKAPTTPQQQRPCPRTYVATCGSDGKVYANECEASNAGAKAVGRPGADGKCPAANAGGARRLLAAVQQPGEPCRCPKVFKPVCGWDGKKYNSKCEAECAGVSITNEKPDASGNLRCSPEAALEVAKPSLAPPVSGGEQQQQQQPTCGCPKIRFPVCTTAAKVFDNSCLAKCAGATVVEARPDASGKCPPPAAAAPAGGAVGTGAPAAKPAGDAAGAKPANAGAPAAPPARKERPCPRNYNPVCFGATMYPNACVAENAGATVTTTPDAKGKCGGAPAPPAGAAAAPSTAAGPAAKPAGNETRPAAGKPGAAEAGPAPAPAGNGTAASGPRPPCKCPRNLRPTCATNGKLYDNPCLAECDGATISDARPDADNKCPTGSAAAGTPTALTASPAPGKASPAKGSPTCACPYILMPTCGADGKAYSNACLAKCAGVATTAAKPVDGKCPQ